MAHHHNILEKLWACVAATEYCAEKCMEEPNAEEMRECIRADRDCAEICLLTARFVARDSRHVRHIMDECVEICNECALECEKHDTPHCRQCARACRECIEACMDYMR